MILNRIRNTYREITYNHRFKEDPPKYAITEIVKYLLTKSKHMKEIHELGTC